MNKVVNWMEGKPIFQAKVETWRRCVKDLTQRKQLLAYIAQQTLSPTEQELWKQEILDLTHQEAKCQALFDELVISRASE